ncbi:hypothetical protein BABINDRAFT_73909 [Babjeviella inositovora NRRL Y-12698]|uniref:Uncharacterized protein n=1 Tax=Babjeviella inositovora NRRL Y-12698 TaxID=984486 RepID=A0A1E3QZT5_9ASCO|nr:uncharacterized protein BABINDRAFT_73909 [Babjeviella inositovora NRRL Y-12698]ODQ82597.1 hypothetical protein BABINDRAFT_73909 [Babjeviella inositovora NRRL Y-12698]
MQLSNKPGLACLHTGIVSALEVLRNRPSIVEVLPKEVLRRIAYFSLGLYGFTNSHGYLYASKETYNWCLPIMYSWKRVCFSQLDSWSIELLHRFNSNPHFSNSILSLRVDSRLGWRNYLPLEQPSLVPSLRILISNQYLISSLILCFDNAAVIPLLFELPPSLEKLSIIIQTPVSHSTGSKKHFQRMVSSSVQTVDRRPPSNLKFLLLLSKSPMYKERIFPVLLPTRSTALYCLSPPAFYESYFSHSRGTQIVKHFSSTKFALGKILYLLLSYLRNTLLAITLDNIDAALVFDGASPDTHCLHFPLLRALILDNTSRAKLADWLELFHRQNNDGPRFGEKSLAVVMKDYMGNTLYGRSVKRMARESDNMNIASWKSTKPLELQLQRTKVSYRVE